MDNLLQGYSMILLAIGMAGMVSLISFGIRRFYTNKQASKFLIYISLFSGYCSLLFCAYNFRYFYPINELTVIGIVVLLLGIYQVQFYRQEKRHKELLED